MKAKLMALPRGIETLSVRTAPSLFVWIGMAREYTPHHGRRAQRHRAREARLRIVAGAALGALLRPGAAVRGAGHRLAGLPARVGRLTDQHRFLGAALAAVAGQAAL